MAVVLLLPAVVLLHSDRVTDLGRLASGMCTGAAAPARWPRVGSRTADGAAERGERSASPQTSRQHHRQPPATVVSASWRPSWVDGRVRGIARPGHRIG